MLHLIAALGFLAVAVAAAGMISFMLVANRAAILGALGLVEPVRVARPARRHVVVRPGRPVAAMRLEPLRHAA